MSSLSSNGNIAINSQQYESVSVECGTRNDRPVLLKLKGERRWCSSELTDACYKEKIKAVTYVCSSAYVRALQSLDAESESSQLPNKDKPLEANDIKNNSAYIAELMVEKRKVEDQWLEIQATRIALNRREVQLQSRRWAFENE